MLLSRSLSQTSSKTEWLVEAQFNGQMVTWSNFKSAAKNFPLIKAIFLSLAIAWHFDHEVALHIKSNRKRYL